MQRVLRDNESVRAEIECADKVFSLSFEPVLGMNYLNVYALDIRDRKQAENELRESERRFRTAVINAPYQVMIHAKGGDVLQLSKSWTEITGYTHEDALRVIHRVYQLEGGERQDDGEWPVITKSGETRYWDFGTTPLGLLPDGRTHVITMAIDITDRRKTEDALGKSEERLRQAQKLESIGRLAGGVAHDFNNLLTTIVGIQEIRRSADRAAALTQQLLAFSRKQVLQPKVIDPNELILNAMKMIGRLTSADIKIYTILCPDIGHVKPDPSQIDQVLMNLAVNAGDAMPEGGTLTIKTENVYLDESYQQQHPETVLGDYVEIEVSDTGHGINEEIVEHMFDPFYTTKDIGKGTGLGLATVYGIVKQSDGYIWVSSKPDHGTTFKIYLPQIEAEGHEARTIERKSYVGGDETILLVEDEDALRKMAKTGLIGLGYSVIESSNGKNAIVMIEDAGYPRIDCL